MTWTNENTGGTTSGVAAFTSTNILRANLVSELATGGTGTTADPWTGWETAVNALPTYSRIHFPAGNYLQASAITIKQGWHISGDGRGTASGTSITRITSTFTGTAFKLNETIGGGGVAVDIRIHDLLLENTNASNVGSGFLLVGGYYLDIDSVTVQGFYVGICIIGLSRWSLSRSSLNLNTKIGFWLSDGSTYTVANGFDQGPTSGATTGQFTGDDGHIFNVNTNHSASAAAIVLEYNFAVTVGPNIKFNGGDRHVWLSAMSGTTIMGGTFEAAANENIRLAAFYYAAQGTASGTNLNTTIGPGNQFTATSTNAAIAVTANNNTILVAGNSFTIGASYAIAGGANATNLSTLNNWLISGTGLIDGASNVYSAFIGDAGGTFAYPSASSSTYLTNARIPNLRTDYVRMATGANTRMGVGTLDGGTPPKAVISNTSITANTQIFVTRIAPGVGGLTGAIFERADLRSVGTSFTMQATTAGDTTTFNWLLIEPN